MPRTTPPINPVASIARMLRLLRRHADAGGHSSSIPGRVAASPAPGRLKMTTALVLMAASALFFGRARASETITFTRGPYEVRTTLTRDQARPLVEHMTRVFERLRRRFDGFERRQDGPLRLLLLDTRRQYLDAMRQHGIDAAHTDGLFFVTEEARGLATWVRGRARSTTRRVLQHEGFHQFAWHYISGDLPPWVNEGLAKYFEDGRLRGDRLELGRKHRARIAALQRAMLRAKLMRLERIVSLTEKQWHQRAAEDRQAGRIMYSQAWSMVYFLIHGEDGRYRSAFEDYLHQLADGLSSEEAFQRSFDVDSFTAMRSPWERFLKRELFR